MYKEIKYGSDADKKHYVYELYTTKYFANTLTLTCSDHKEMTSIMVETDKRAGSKAFKEIVKELSEKHGVRFHTYKNAKNTYAEYKDVWGSCEEFKEAYGIF